MTSAGILGEPRGFQYKHGDCPLDGFTIQRAAGRGGFGEVYYAISDGGREVALKLIHTYEQIELRGISHCMNLKSPHLVTIFDVKYGLDGRPWVIMEFVSGPSLRELLDAAPSGLGVPKAAFFLREIAKSLTYLHDCGIVHRDLKPGNIFYENGYVKIGDYGLSKAILGGQNSAQTVTVGTVHYMAPEIGEGHYDKGIDLYALGALLYEMLTGQVPFFGASPAEVLMKHLNAAVDLSAIEEPFATVIRKAMAKNPAERYQSAQEMVEAVFGAEHVRNSVSHFAPESLSMVAGHVARKLPGEPSFAGSSSITNQPERDVLGQLGQRMHRLMNQGVEAAMRPCRRFGRRLDQFMGQPADQQRNEDAAPFGRASRGNPHASVRQIDDPVSGPQRRALAAVAIGLAAIGCGLANSDMNSVVGTMFALFATVGGTFGILFGSNRIAPGLPPDQKFLSKLAIGGFGGICAAIFSAPIVFSHARFSQGLCEAWLAILASLFILDWRHRTNPDREARVDLGNVVSALILGAIIGAIIDRNMTLVAGVVAGIALAVQIACPWDSQAADDRVRQAREAKRASTPVAEMPGAPVTPLEQFSSAGHIPLRPASTGGIDATATPGDMTVPALSSRPVSRFGRAAFLFMFVGLATLALFMLGMISVGSNIADDERAMMFGFAVPSALLAGLCLHRSFATTFSGYWPFLFRPLLQICCIGSIVVSFSFLTIGGVRRSDMPPVIFFIVFPAVALLVLTFLSRSGGNMSQMNSTISAPITTTAASDDFFLARVAGGAGRFVASTIGTTLLLVATLLAIAVVADLPGLANSNLVDAKLGNEFRRTFGNADWTRLMRFFGLIASFIFAVVAVASLMQVRKRSGVIHMLRAPAAAVLLFVFVLLLGRALPAWSELTATENGWELVDQYVKHVASSRVIAAVGPLLAAILLLLWPARRRSVARIAAVQQEGTR